MKENMNLLSQCVLLSSFSVVFLSCSLMIDVSPDGLMQSAGTDIESGFQAGVGGADDGGDVAGDIGGVIGGAVAGEVGGATGGDETGGSIVHQPDISGELTTPFGQFQPPQSGRRQLVDHSMAGEWGSQSGITVDTFLSGLLPEPNCIVYQTTEERCLHYTTRSDDEMCEDWISHFGQDDTRPWTGDRQTCQSGEYSGLGVGDFSRNLNLHRRQMGLEEVTVQIGATSTECALVHDLGNRDGFNPRDFADGKACFSSLLQESVNANGMVGLTGFWSLFIGLQGMIGLTSFSPNNALENIAVLRLILLSPELTELEVGSRGRGSCYLPQWATNPTSAQVLSYPPAGVNPFSMVKPANHDGKIVPWTLFITDPVVNNVSVSLSRFDENAQEWIDAGIDLGSTTISIQSGTGIVFTPHQTPDPNVPYLTRVEWTGSEGDQSAELYLGFTLCGGLTQPSTCSLFPDDCVLNGTSCTLENDGTQHCIWRGPLLQNQDCSNNLGTESCAVGACLINGPQDSCLPYCDPQSTSNSYSCDVLCPNSHGQLSEAVHICLP